MSIGFFFRSAVARVTQKIVMEIHQKSIALLKMGTGTKVFNILESPMLIPAIYLYALCL
jgi:hypothetical protein